MHKTHNKLFLIFPRKTYVLLLRRLGRGVDPPRNKPGLSCDIPWDDWAFQSVRSESGRNRRKNIDPPNKTQSHTGKYTNPGSTN